MRNWRFLAGNTAVRSGVVLIAGATQFPGTQASLNALCRRFETDNSHRDLHGALVDADLLASVYIELLGGRQPNLSLEPDIRIDASTRQDGASTPALLFARMPANLPVTRQLVRMNSSLTQS